ncbi:hypothetical protein [Thiomicrorhabdus aquaedulcis]|uniref:hypothetical protein n=1 Tax=Thiomicrorhabdus aquaedulcis TaxID=2211106 RepID=UPI000FD94D6B|nr:hypothetical protein [Thiomicrorhabdus aquaedulcis]
MKKSILTTAILGLTLTGCGGGGDSAAGGEQDVPTISGVVADGYLSGATACLDLNNNSVCDPEEPQDITDSFGQYSFNSDSTQGTILIEVHPAAIDSDTGMPVGGNGYVLKAPIVNQKFITPITTMIQANMDSGMTYTEALAQVSADLGVPVIDKDKMLEDYVARQAQDPDFAFKESMHKKAVLAATVARELTNEYYEGLNSDFTPEGKLAALNAIAAQLAQSAPAIATMADATSDFSRLRLTQALQDLRVENPTLFEGSISSGKSISSYYSGCFEEPTLPGEPAKFAYYKYTFMDDGFLKADYNYYFDEGDWNGAYTKCANKERGGYTTTKILFEYTMDKPLSTEYDSLIALTYQKENDTELEQDITTYSKARMDGTGYLCFGANEGRYSPDEFNNVDVTIDSSQYSALRNIGIGAKTDVGDALSSSVDIYTIHRCINVN